MGSKSNSSQSTVYNTSTQYEYNTLDGGAIEEAFDFAKENSKSAFDFGGEAFDFAEYVSERAFDAVGDTYSTALTAQNAQLGQMSNLVKSTQTQGATDLIDANQEIMKTMFMAISIIVIAIILVAAFAGKKR